MYFLARRWSGNEFAAAFAGVAFAFNGFTLNLLMWPSHIATFSWLPWVILAVEAAWRKGGRKIFLAAIVGAFQMLAGGPETILLTWLIASALWLQQFISAETARAKMFWRFPLVVTLVFALSAAQLLPFLDLVAHAQRESGYTDLRWSMPASGLANFLVPMAFGTTMMEGIFFQNGQYWTSSYYLGLGTLWLALLAFLLARDFVEPKPKIKLLGFIAFIALLCALGENTPFYPLVRKLIPQLSFITYPIKFVMVVVFAAPLLAAFTLTRLQQAQKKLLLVGAGLMLAIFTVIYLASMATRPDAETHAALFNGISRAGFLVAIGVILWLVRRQKSNLGFQALGFGLILVAWLDVCSHEPAQNPAVSSSVFQQNLARTKLAMQPQPELGGSRAMLSPQAALDLTRFGARDAKNNFLAKRLGYCANANLLDAVPKVDGFVSLTPREFDWMLSLIYSVTNGNWTALEDFMGVSQTTAPGKSLEWAPRENFLPLVTAGQKPVFLDDTNTLWNFGRNAFDGREIVFLPPEMKPFVTVTNQSAAKILNARFTNRTVAIEVEANESALVVVAQTFYHNWQAEIDGQPAPLLRANVTFQAVQVPQGHHQVRLVYRDQAFALGAIISLAALATCALGFFPWRRA
jgi:hypothetical protein